MKPNTRKEMFLDAIADGEPCNLVPANRKELLLQRMAESAGGGGGGGGVFVVKVRNVEDWDNEYVNTFTTDTAYSDAKAAIIAGTPVIFMVHRYVISGGVETFKKVKMIVDAEYRAEDDYIIFNYEEGTFSAEGLEMAVNG